MENQESNPTTTDESFTGDKKERSIQWKDLFYGETEMQEMEFAEADLHKHRKNCKKNPNHIGFIPIDVFNAQHLPVGHQDNDLFDIIKLEANLTVRVDVKIVSPNRQEFWPNSSAPYPYYIMRGSTNMTRVGTGRIREVMKYTAGQSQYGDKHALGYITCTCRRCQSSCNQNGEWWEIMIWTARHVVYDQHEADHTIFKLFYDTDTSPTVILDEVTVEQVFKDEDWCQLKCVTCDEAIAGKIVSTLQSWDELADKIYHKYRTSRDVHKLAYMVSHPHGCPKQISIGHWLDKIQDDGAHTFITKFSYVISTCPGSSGAQVNLLGYSWKWVDHVHSGSLAGINYSGSGLVK